MIKQRRGRDIACMGEVRNAYNTSLGSLDRRDLGKDFATWSWLVSQLVKIECFIEK
jgi:hypothetical protein